ncbi:hypothetical protein VHEMI05560 [[Torrubiella] hemipterigena]|uniref:Uncharacterized protein n=1 Tax=[Torrubiella] hemipterigena TaxID=1531966 RepID=A0A0A1TH04_9HYPO|nr:hypothetical protein VHEMI05560 [[Torrubiella] hemipterigena]
MMSTLAYYELGQDNRYIFTSDERATIALLQQSKHLALPIRTGLCEFNGHATYGYLQGFAKQAKTLALVVASTTHREAADGIFETQLLFKQPSRRCRLRQLPPGTWGEIVLDSAWTDVEDVCSRGPVTLDPIMTATRTHNRQNLYYLQHPDYDNMPISVQTFEERQPDGSWTQICAERLYTRRYDFPAYRTVPEWRYELNDLESKLLAAFFIPHNVELAAQGTYTVDEAGKLSTRFPFHYRT